MSRPKTAPDSEVISLINDYFYTECHGDGAKLKLPELAHYIAAHGYSDYRVTTLRRNRLAREHIDSLKNNCEATKLSFLMAYETLNIPVFLASHTSRASLIQALSARDDYYRQVAETAVELTSKYKELSDETKDLKTCVANMKAESEVLQHELQSSRDETRALQSENKRLRDILGKYVYEGIARVILEKEGIIPNIESVVSSVAVEKNVVTASTNIIEFASVCSDEDPHAAEQQNYKSDVISKMMDPFK